MDEAPWIAHEGAKFRDELTRYKMANHPFKTHPFFGRIERGEAPRELVHRWAEQFYPWLACVPIAMAERFDRCSWEASFNRTGR